MLSSIPAAFAKKLPKVGLARWFGYIGAAANFLKLWSRPQLLVFYVCLMSVALDSSKVSLGLSARLKPTSTTGGDIEKSTTKGDREIIRRARALCRNRTSVAPISSIGPFRSIYRLNWLITQIVKPLRDLHSDQNERNRSVQESMSR